MQWNQHGSCEREKERSKEGGREGERGEGRTGGEREGGRKRERAGGSEREREREGGGREILHLRHLVLSLNTFLQYSVYLQQGPSKGLD